MADDPIAKELSQEAPEQIKDTHAFMMGLLRNAGLLDDLRKAGLTDDSELRSKRESGAGMVRPQNDNLATNVKSVPQPDR